MLAVMLEIIDTSIVNVALPDMMGNLGATVDEISWVVTSYIIANVIVIPMTSWLAGRFGRRRYFASSILLFTAASVLCGLATSLRELVLFRVIQGLGGGALLSSGQAVMVEIFPPQRQGTGQAIFGVGAMLGPSLGPTLGGWITDHWSWPWIFYVNVPLGIVAALLCWRYLPRAARARVRRTSGVDWLGIALLVVGIARSRPLLERGHRLDWFESDFIRLARARRRRRARRVRLARAAHRAIRSSTCACSATARSWSAASTARWSASGSTAAIFLFPLFTQGVLHWTSWQSGIGMLPVRAHDRADDADRRAARLAHRPGAALRRRRGVFLPALWAMSQWTIQSGWWDLIWPQIGRGIAMGLMFVPLSIATLRALPPADVLQGAGLYNLFRQTGGSLGIAVLATLIDHRGVLHHAYLAESVTSFSPATRQRLAALAAGLAARGLDPASALDGARRALDGILSAQSAVLAFRDCYLVILLLFVLLSPLIPLMRRPALMVPAPGERAAETAAGR